MATSDVTERLLRAVDRIGPLIEEHAADAEANRQLSSPVFDAMYQAGLFEILVPRARGGHELHPVDCMRIWEAVARIDSAAAWNLVMNQAVANFAAWLPVEGADELFRDGIPTAATAFHPLAAATRVEGGWRITGQVPFASGCRNVKWLAMPAAEMEGGRRRLIRQAGNRCLSWRSFPAAPPALRTPGTQPACAELAQPILSSGIWLFRTR